MTRVRVELILNVAFVVIGVLGMALHATADEPGVIEIGSRRELFVDDFLIDRRDGLELRLQAPVPREVVLEHDAPWEGSGCGYHTIFRDGEIVRMYYIAADLTNADGSKMASRPVFACYAESRDGIHWTKPELGLFEFAGSKKNNIVWSSPGLDNFTPFKDANPDCRPDERYKAVALGPGGLHAYKSADGIHWSPLAERPIITKGAFDTQNNAFWDPVRKHYWCYIRDFHDGIRDIRVATSTDFRTWSEPERIAFIDSPDEPLYTNQVRPYDRAPHLFLGFPTRYVERRWSPTFDALPDPAHRQGADEVRPEVRDGRHRRPVHDEPRRADLPSLGRDVPPPRPGAQGQLALRRRLPEPRPARDGGRGPDRPAGALDLRGREQLERPHPAPALHAPDRRVRRPARPAEARRARHEAVRIPRQGRSR